jgi:membrane protein required for colicin V production
MVDLLLLALIVLSAGLGLWRGLVKEAMSLVTWLAAIWLAWRFGWLTNKVFEPWLDAPELQLWAGRFLIFLVVLIAGGLVSWLVTMLVRYSPLSGSDRALGGLFGLGRGALVIGLLAIVVEFAGFSEEAWWRSSKLRPYGEQIASGIRYYASLGSQYLREQDLVSARGTDPGVRPGLRLF